MRIWDSFTNQFEGYRRVVNQRDVLLLIVAGWLSEIGDWLAIVALVVLADGFGEGAIGVGVMLAVRTLPRLLLQLPAGSLIDRMPGPAMLIGSHLAAAVIALGFIAIEPFDAFWLLLVLVFLLELANVVGLPAYRSEVARISPPDSLGAVNGLVAVGMTTAQFIGPLLGGVLLQAFGSAPLFVINALTFLGVVAAVLLVPRATRATTASAEPGGGAGDEDVPVVEGTGPQPAVVQADPVPAGYGWMLRHSALGLFVLALFLASISVRGVIALFIVQAERIDLDERGIGYFYAAVAVGSVAGGLLVGTREHRDGRALRWVAGGLILLGLGLNGFGWGQSAVVVCVALLAAGFAVDVYEVAGLTYFQHLLSTEASGRLVSLMLVAISLGALVGSIVAPVLETVLGTGSTILILTMPASLLGALLFFQVMDSATSDAIQ